MCTRKKDVEKLSCGFEAELMKGIGKGVRSFKEGMNNVEKEIDEIKDIEQKG